MLLCCLQLEIARESVLKLAYFKITFTVKYIRDMISNKNVEIVKMSNYPRLVFFFFVCFLDAREMNKINLPEIENTFGMLPAPLEINRV